MARRNAKKTSRKKTSRKVAKKASSKKAPAKFRELAAYTAVADIRASGLPLKKVDVLPPGVAARFKRLAPGLYKYGWGPKKGEVIRAFPHASLRGALTSTRIGARAVGEYHWVVDNFDPSFPMVIRAMDEQGRTVFRVEEFARELARVPVLVRRTSRKRRT